MTIKTMGQCAVNIVEYGLDLTYDATVIVAYGYEIENESCFYDAKGSEADAKFFSDMTNSHLPGALLKVFPEGMKWYSLVKDAQDSSDLVLSHLKPEFEKKGIKLTNFQILNLNMKENDAHEASSLFKAASDKANLSKEQLIDKSAKDLEQVIKLTSDAMLVPGVNYWPDETIQQADERIKSNPFLQTMRNSLGTLNMAAIQAGSLSNPSEWTCSCGSKNTGKFCSNCGAPAPKWTCKCGHENYTAFCSECGMARPKE